MLNTVLLPWWGWVLVGFCWAGGAWLVWLWVRNATSVPTPKPKRRRWGR